VAKRRCEQRNFQSGYQQRRKNMTDIKKTAKNNRQGKAKKLELNKETIKDLSAKGADQIKGRGVTASRFDGCRN
jgi:hypothetical protein